MHCYAGTLHSRTHMFICAHFPSLKSLFGSEIQSSTKLSAKINCMYAKCLLSSSSSFIFFLCSSVIFLVVSANYFSCIEGVGLGYLSQEYMKKSHSVKPYANLEVRRKKEIFHSHILALAAAETDFTGLPDNKTI